MSSTTCLLIALMALPMFTMADKESTAVVTIGRCPDVSTKKDFDVKQYAGKWYPYIAFNSAPEYGVNCVSAEYILRGPNDLKVVNSGYLDINVLKNRLYRIPIVAVGSGLAPDVDKNPGALAIAVSNPPTASSPPSYLVLDTDYTTYSLVYRCFQNLFLKTEAVYVLTRERGVAPANLKGLKRILTKYGVDVSNFKKSRHEDC